MNKRLQKKYDALFEQHIVDESNYQALLLEIKELNEDIQRLKNRL